MLLDHFHRSWDGLAVQAEVNPYQAPGSEATKPCDAVGDPRASRRISLAWVGVFLLNLGVPLLLAWSLTEQGGRLGMFTGIAVLFLVDTGFAQAREASDRLWWSAESRSD